MKVIYLKGSFWLHSNNETTQRKLFTEELNFAELSTQGEHVMWILYGN